MATNDTETEAAALNEQIQLTSHGLRIEFDGMRHYGTPQQLEVLRPLYEAALGNAKRRYGQGALPVGVITLNLAYLYGRAEPNKAKEAFRSSLAIFMASSSGSGAKSIPPEVRNALGQYVWNAGLSYYDMLMLETFEDQALQVLRQVVLHFSDVYGERNRDTIEAINRLGMHFYYVGDSANAQGYLDRAVRLSEQTPGLNVRLRAAIKDNLSAVHWQKGELSEAIAANRAANQLYLSVVKGGNALSDPDIQKIQNNYGKLLQANGRYNDALEAYRRVLVARQNDEGADCYRCAIQHYNIAAAVLEWFVKDGGDDKLVLAVEHANASVEINKRFIGENAPQTLSDYALLADIFLKKGDLQGALRWSNLAISGYDEHRISLVVDRDDYSNIVGRPHEIRLSALIKFPRTVAYDRLAFISAQALLESRVAKAVAQATTRLAQGTKPAAALLRSRQDAVQVLQGLNRTMTVALQRSDNIASDAQIRSLRNRIAEVERSIASTDRQLGETDARMAELAIAAPVGIDEARNKLLREDEALVMFVHGKERIFSVVLTKDSVVFRELDKSPAAITELISHLRCGLDFSAWIVPNEGCRKLFGTSFNDVDVANGKLPPFDLDRAYRLFQELFGASYGLVRGKHLLIVPSGALASIPLHVLVTNEPTSTDVGLADWLIRGHSITVVPSVASWAALRHTAKQSGASRALIGFGNPLLDGNPQDPQHGAANEKLAEMARAQVGCASSATRRSAHLRSVGRPAAPVPKVDGLADIDHVRRQAPLPETADELCEVARSIGANLEEIRIGARATETEVKGLSDRGDLAQYRILHFATHGVLAGQIRGTREPGLIFSPPLKATVVDDGYLSSGEIATLKLDAEWVILSACNTAGGSGDSDVNEAMSGMARAFFFAGARALLVSHWEVDSDAAVTLITAAIGEMAKDKSLGRAEAHRRAMLTLMSKRLRPSDQALASHPSLWAPFVVVGEGGAGL